jgi:hypothetical protein
MSHAASNITMLATLPSFIKVRSMLISKEMRLDNVAKTVAAVALYSSTAATCLLKFLLQGHLIRFCTQLQQQSLQGQGEQ